MSIFINPLRSYIEEKMVIPLFIPFIWASIIHIEIPIYGPLSYIYEKQHASKITFSD